MNALLNLQAMDVASDGIEPRASGLSWFCNGDNSSASMWCG